jgi:hypothetical protein
MGFSGSKNDRSIAGLGAAFLYQVLSFAIDQSQFRFPLLENNSSLQVKPNVQ